MLRIILCAVIVTLSAGSVAAQGVERARLLYQVCLLTEFHAPNASQLGRKELEIAFTAIASRCWIENKNVAYEMAVESQGVEGAKNLRMDEIARNLEVAVIYDLVSGYLSD